MHQSSCLCAMCICATVSTWTVQRIVLLGVRILEWVNKRHSVYRSDQVYRYIPWPLTIGHIQVYKIAKLIFNSVSKWINFDLVVSQEYTKLYRHKKLFQICSNDIYEYYDIYFCCSFTRFEFELYLQKKKFNWERCNLIKYLKFMCNIKIAANMKKCNAIENRRM